MQKGMMFRLFAPFAAGAFLASALVVPIAHAQQGQRDEQGEARKDLNEGKVLPLREIEKRILPQMRGMQYLGPAYDSVAMAYRLKFIKDGKVTFVDVDARTGRVLSRSQ
jgi:uncharacterized membrane protein YkoI